VAQGAFARIRGPYNHDGTCYLDKLVSDGFPLRQDIKAGKKGEVFRVPHY
jgi:hypothetical protein